MGYDMLKVRESAEKQIEDLLGKKVKLVVDMIDGGEAKINEMRYIVRENSTMASLAEFSLVQLPGCCGVCVSYHASVSKGMRRKGLGTLLCGIRKDIARALGYGCMICTDVTTNTTQQHVLNKNGWKEIHTFRNPRTWNDVNIHVVNI